MRGRLQKLGILRESGHEHFNGSVVFPMFDVEGHVLGCMAAKSRRTCAKGSPLHLYLPGPHRGVWNEQALQASKEIILCESFIDALTFWCAGFRNVTASYGVNGFTEDHKAGLPEAWREAGVDCLRPRRSRGDGGGAVRKNLWPSASTLRVLFPKGMDANEYALKVTPAAKAWVLLLNGASGWRRSPAAKEEITPCFPLAADCGSPRCARRNRDHMKSDRRYRVRGFAENTSYDLLKINLLASRGDGFHVDTFNLYTAHQCAAFVKQAAGVGRERRGMKGDLRHVLGQLEAMQDEQIRAALTPKPREVTMSEEDRTAALALLRDPNLLERVTTDFERCGLVGEETNKQVAYLATVSRHLDSPLAVVVQSSSAAGKSSLMDAVLQFVPEEERIQYSSMTGQSLFYMGEMDLKHKVLAIVEEEGARSAAYALKLLQSEGALSIASTGKDPATGKLVTHQYRVEGPVMMFLTTTAIDIDEELLNRCLVLSVNEDRAQTQAKWGWTRVGMRTAYPSIEIYAYGSDGSTRTIYTKSESGNLGDLKSASQPVPAVSPQ